MPSGLAGTTWANFNLFRQSLILLYSLIALALWHAPIYGWALRSRAGQGAPRFSGPCFRCSRSVFLKDHVRVPGTLHPC
jgi:hypothetical protein